MPGTAPFSWTSSTCRLIPRMCNHFPQYWHSERSPKKVTELSQLCNLFAAGTGHIIRAKNRMLLFLLTTLCQQLDLFLLQSFTNTRLVIFKWTSVLENLCAVFTLQRLNCSVYIPYVSCYTVFVKILVTIATLDFLIWCNSWFHISPTRPDVWNYYF